MRAPINQNHHVAVARRTVAVHLLIPHRIAPDQLLNRRDQLRAFAVADGLLHDVLRLREPIARRGFSLLSHRLRRLVRFRRFHRFHFRQTQTRNVANDFACLRRAVRAEIHQRAIGLREHLIHPVNHRLAVAPRELRLQHHRVVLLAQQILRLIEQARIRAAKAINRLFHIADQKDSWLVAIALIRRQPIVNDVPLQGVGVLKLIEQ